MAFPSLETERLLLTELRADDEAALFNLFSNPSVVEYYDLDAFREHSQADTIPGNSASESLLRRLGFKEEGLRRECGYWKNKFHDLKCFGLLRTEY